ncbi:MAG: FHA domain-containing protein [Lachnospiraceae bacterium]|nr:FHA domain-containing protein [Lachnospiraceae bacterium]
MEQGKKKRRINRKSKNIVFDILILLCGAGLIPGILWHMRTQRWMLLLLIAVGACMICALLSLISSCQMEGEDRGTESLPGQGLQRLILLDAQGKPIKSWNLEGKISLIIGKAGQNQELDVDLSDCEYSSFIDFQHAVLNFSVDQWYVEDLESHNGVKVKKVEDGECYRVLHRPCKVTAGDVLYIANTKLLLT